LDSIRGVIGISLIAIGTVAMMAFVGACLGRVTGVDVVVGTLGLGCFRPGSRMVLRYLRHPRPERLVRVVRANAREGWMDLRFGNRDYARLIADLNPLKSDNTSRELM
jgi:hypothetical protein